MSEGPENERPEVPEKQPEKREHWTHARKVLNHPWLVAIVGGAIALVIGTLIVNALTSGSSEPSSSSSSASVPSSTSTPTSTSTASSSTSAQPPAPVRDPPVGTTSIEADSSDEFFDQRLLVSVGDMSQDRSIINRLTVQLDDAPCSAIRLVNGNSVDYVYRHSRYTVTVADIAMGAFADFFAVNDGYQRAVALRPRCSKTGP